MKSIEKYFINWLKISSALNFPSCEDWQLLRHFRNYFIKDGLLHLELNFELLHCVVDHLLLVLSQWLFEHVGQSGLPYQICLLLIDVHGLSILPVKGDWLWNEPTETASPLNDLGNGNTENFIQSFILLILLVWFFAFIIADWLSVYLTEGFLMNFRVFEVLDLVVFEISWKYQPRQGLAVNASRPLEIQGLIENVDDGLDEEGSDLKHLGVQLKIGKKGTSCEML